MNKTLVYKDFQNVPKYTAVQRTITKVTDYKCPLHAITERAKQVRSFNSTVWQSCICLSICRSAYLLFQECFTINSERIKRFYVVKLGTSVHNFTIHNSIDFQINPNNKNRGVVGKKVTGSKFCKISREFICVTNKRKI